MKDKEYDNKIESEKQKIIEKRRILEVILM